MSSPIATEAKPKYLTGFCNIGYHEGTKPRSPSGNPIKVCIMWQDCKCSCHKEITEMYEMAGVPREIHENTEYVPFQPTWKMPVFGVDYGMNKPALSGEPLDIPGEQKRNGDGQAGARTFAPTPSGRAARGQLEDQVLEVVTEWMIDKGELCTPAYIAWDIARYHKIKEPSTGAIGAVFERWIAYGFAVIERKPVRFIDLTEEGKEKGLDYLKAKFKHNKRMGKN